jgi:peptidase M28-like protein
MIAIVSHASRVALVGTLVASALLSPSPAHAQAERWWADVKALADDSMRGRNTGSVEHKKAAEYVAAAFKAAGLKPIGVNGYIQPVAFLGRKLDESKSSLALVKGGREEKLILGEDAILTARAPLAPRVNAPVVFAGYGLDLPEYGHDDLSKLDLKGKVVAYLAGSPKGIPGPVLSHAHNAAWKTFQSRGAVGMITFSAETSFARSARGRATAPQPMALAESAIDPQSGNTLSVQWNAARAEQLFAGSPERFAALMAKADSGLPLPTFALPVRIRSKVAMRETKIVSQNVAGLLTGSDPQLRDEYVVLTAHLDHVGVGRVENGDSIYNGAMDNASGTALLMDVARELKERGTALKRSVIFLAVTGEEKGLLGSRYYAAHPTVPIFRIAANLNTDMFLPIFPFTKLMVIGLEESDLADDARRAAQASGVEVINDPEPEENRFVRSDQYSFILRGVPALALKVGFDRDTPEHKAVAEFRSKRYHHASDDLAQPVDFQSAAGFERTYIALVTEVANRASRPEYLSNSYFKRFRSRTTGPVSSP